ncbi:sensor histidine kinase [Halarcobacter ebronensis]|uniref:histidine kinase n=1 Tax=Halarcobacter ebronensis TaxID=1462615 RepID=A0A4Q1AR71_9BACT|nr:HAMP domain-containing sensor histidine kinase [Halarcobacter ebronensis]QKF81537.1 two-component system sensor histidine kinase [Halarcobacter ebronensis]RXK05467.1 histidine kinase [Halarcobacter ebronensis]
MFNKEGIPFFVIMIPFLSIVFIAFFTISYYLKINNLHFEEELKEYKALYLELNPTKSFDLIEKEKRATYEKNSDEFIKFVEILTVSILIFMALFTALMNSIINDTIKKYILQVQNKEKKLQSLNKNLATKVQEGIEEAKRKDRTILQQSKLARMGSMISMIAHQWRQPLTELSGILMELETAVRFKKANDTHILSSIDRSDKMIEFMSKTIDDFRNFYKPDKKKENFYLLDSINSAVNLIDATFKEKDIEFRIITKQNEKIYGYPTEFAQVILNLLTNAKDVLVEKNIKKPKIELTISKVGVNNIIELKDNAGGIEQENIDNIFDPYFSTKSPSKGTGLGLYISKLIIERNMGGELTVYNNEEGAVFKIVLLG